MAPPLPSASIELDYPLFAIDFDPEDANRVVVGGGGGAGRSGVMNKIVRTHMQHTTHAFPPLSPSAKLLPSIPCPTCADMQASS